MNQFETLVEELNDKCEKIGLYMQHSSILTDNASLESMGDEDPEAVDVNQLMQDGEASFAISAVYVLGDLAFDDRIADPDGFAAEQEFKAIAPEDDMKKDSFLNDLAAWKEEFGVDDDDED